MSIPRFVSDCRASAAASERVAVPKRRLVAANAASSSWRRRRTVATMSFTTLGCARWGWSLLPHTGQAVSGASMLRRCTASGETTSSARSARGAISDRAVRSRSCSDSALAISVPAALISCAKRASWDSPRARSAAARMYCSQAVLASRTASRTRRRFASRSWSAASSIAARLLRRAAILRV